ncbi:MAG: hypothetical protein PF638_07755 [Candidatus Delongbacteria bacterium]|jgi:hypothetical protein|nr:hypothetical protein [Candidatus Delongbacteria bacterium]
MIRILILMLILVNVVFGQFSIDVESGVAGTTYNDIRIPGDTGTSLSLKDDLKDESFIFFRARLNYTFAEKHTLSLLYAPLKIESHGTLDFDVNYRDSTFLSGEPIESIYQFNSYRLTYRYMWIQKEKFDFGIGFTAKIRDAYIKLENDDTKAGKENIGFVPILNFWFDYRFTDKLSLLIEGDALAAPQGRAEDVLSALTYNISDKYKFKMGYRILEGGADNDEVYTFSLINYFVLGFIAEF